MASIQLRVGEFVNQDHKTLRLLVAEHVAQFFKRCGTAPETIELCGVDADTHIPPTTQRFAHAAFLRAIRKLGRRK